MQDIFPQRIKMIQGVIIFFSFLFLINLFYIQLIDNKYKIKAKDNAIKELIEYPSRGLIYDRNNKLIVHNTNQFEIMVTNAEVDANLDTSQLCKDLAITQEYFLESMKKARKASRYRPYVFLKYVDDSNYQRFQEHIFKYKGFFGQTRFVRDYPYANGALLFGDVGEIDSSQIKKYADTYTYLSGDYIGKNGIEVYYEDLLRGQRGIRTVVVDALNRVKGSYANGENDNDPIAGKNLQASIDINIQTLGEELLTNKRGSIIAIEPSTGEVLALCNGPTYDPNLLRGGNRNKYYPKLLLNKYKPLYNRAIQGLYPPGSTFKAPSALVALQMGAINPNFAYYCPGYYPIGKKSLKCSHRHAPCRNIEEGLTQSCNPYFCQVFRESIEVSNSKRFQKDYDRWYKNICRFGYRRKLGIDLKNEKRGNVPDTAYYNKIYKNQWRATTVISLGIGQGEILATPLQMANSYCVIANKGYYITPHVIKGIDANGKFEPNTSKKIKVNVPIDKLYFDRVTDGLEMVVQAGTARASKIEGIALCGKTGTAQNPHGEDHSIFVGFAPKVNPKIVIACIVENGGGGGGLAAPIVSLMAERYLKDSLPPASLNKYSSIKNRHLINFQIDE
jgi:penicillin-binding protein 2